MDDIYTNDKSSGGTFSGGGLCGRVVLFASGYVCVVLSPRTQFCVTQMRTRKKTRSGVWSRVRYNRWSHKLAENNPFNLNGTKSQWLDANMARRRPESYADDFNP